MLNSLGDSLVSGLLVLGLLLDLLLGDVLTVLPADLAALAFFDDVLLGHHEGLLQLLVGEVVVLLEGEDDVESIALVVEVALDIEQVHQDGSVLLLDQATDSRMVKHGSQPESWDSQGAVLDFLDVARVDLNLLEVFIIKLLSSSLVFLEESSGWLDLALQNLVSLIIDLLVELIVFEFKFSIDFLFLFIEFESLVLYASDEY